MANPYGDKLPTELTRYVNTKDEYIRYVLDTLHNRINYPNLDHNDYVDFINLADMGVASSFNYLLEILRINDEILCFMHDFMNLQYFKTTVFKKIKLDRAIKFLDYLMESFFISELNIPLSRLMTTLSDYRDIGVDLDRIYVYFSTSVSELDCSIGNAIISVQIPKSRKTKRKG